MLDFPVWDRCRKIMEYFLCYDCCHRIIKKCKWMAKASIASPINWKWQTDEVNWCAKMEDFCNPSSSPEGYKFCPQIREWEEEDSDVVKALNRKFEEELKAKKKAHLKKCRKVYEGIKHV